MLMPALSTVRCLAGSTELAELASELELPTMMAISLADIDLNELSTLVLLHDPRQALVDLAALQASTRAHGVPLLVVDWLADRVRIGPLVLPDAPRCALCRDHRIANNLRRPHHCGGRIDAIARPGAMANAAIRELLSNVLRDGADERLVNGYATVQFRSLQIKWHRFTPLTGCQGCDRGAVNSDRLPGSLQLAERLKVSADAKRVDNPLLSIQSLREAFVDRESGVIKHVFQDATSALMPMCVAEMQLPGKDVFESGYGRAEEAEKSELIAILEAVERYAGHCPRAGQATLRGSYPDLVGRHGADHVADPRRFILHGEAQYRDPSFTLRRFDLELEFDWCWGHSLVSGEPVLVPEQLVYYRTETKADQSVNRFVFDSSNGCSLGGCFEEAILCGLYELVERDAYLTAWYARQPLRRISSASISDPRSRGLIERSWAEGYEIHLFDMSTDTAIPAVWAMIVDPGLDPVVKSYCASACHGRWDEAIFSALVEITTSMGVYRRAMRGQREQAEALLADHTLVREMPDHVLLFSHPNAYRELAFLGGGDEVSMDDCRARLPDFYNIDLTVELQRHLDHVAQVAQDVIVVEQSFRELQPLGLSCVKVLAPGLLPVTFGHQYRRLDPDRVTSAAQARGYGGSPFTGADLNPFPHNFP